MSYFTAPSSCFPPFEDGEAGCFYMSKVKMTWLDGRNHCRSLGADLAVPTDFDAFLSYATRAGLPQDVWLGIYDQKWLNGSRVAKELWYDGQPNGPPQYCARKYNSRLADAPCANANDFLCEIK
nr:lithostathine-1-alpha-like [Penaeus vannamei]